MGSERYEHIKKTTKPRYIPGSPVVLAAVALLKDNITGQTLAQLKFKSVSVEKISAVFVDIECKDVTGASLKSVEGFQILDLSAGHNVAFGQKTPIQLPDERTRNITINVRKVLFEGGSSWEAKSDMPWEELPACKPLDTALGIGLANQYRRNLHQSSEELQTKYSFRNNEECPLPPSRFKHEPFQHQDLWFCVCGAVNKEQEDHCLHCELKKELVFSALDKERLTACKKEYDEEMRLVLEVKKLKQKKQLKLGAIASAAVTGFIILLVSIVSIANAVNYSTAVKLSEQGKNLEAAQKFGALGDYKDSAERRHKLCLRLPGSTVTIGKDDSGRALEWIVLTYDDERSLIIAKKISRGFTAYSTSSTYSLEKCLNEICEKWSFTDDEKAMQYSMFCLSAEDAEKYFPSAEDRIPINSIYEEWWLCTSGNQEGLAYVKADGYINFSGATYEHFGVRPAMWVKAP